MTAQSWPRRARARGSEPATSARPPVLAKPTTSEAASRIFGLAPFGITGEGTHTPAPAEKRGHKKGTGPVILEVPSPFYDPFFGQRSAASGEIINLMSSPVFGNVD